MKPKSSTEILDFHIDNLDPGQRGRVLAAMEFYARQCQDIVYTAWERNRDDMAKSMITLEDRIKELEGLTTTVKH